MIAPTDRPAWLDQAACAGMDVALFFPTRGESTSFGLVDVAETVEGWAS